MDKKSLPNLRLLEKQLKEKLKAWNTDIRIPEKDLKIDGSYNQQLKKAITKELSIKDVKKILGLRDADIAEMFYFKNVMSYRNSSAKDRIEKGIVKLYKLIKE
jgi:hypothetical protein